MSVGKDRHFHFLKFSVKQRLRRLQGHARLLAKHVAAYLASSVVNMVALAWCRNEVGTAVALLQRSTLRHLLWDRVPMSIVGKSTVSIEGERENMLNSIVW